MKRNKTVLSIFIVVISALLMATAAVAMGGSFWPSAGQDRQNSRHQSTETIISPANVGSLLPLWVITTGGNVTATPAVDGQYVYFPDHGGNLYKADRLTGEVIWQRQISQYSGVPNDISTVTPAIDGNLLILGTQSGRFFSRAKVVAINKNSGDLVWMTEVDSHPNSVISQSAVVFAGRVYVGVDSIENVVAAFLPGYSCCTFQGSMMALDAKTGNILWKTVTAPAGFSGNPVVGSTPVVDPKRGTVYFTTGSNYSLPQGVQDCIAAAGGDPEAQSACNSPDNFFDAFLALDWQSGAVKWASFTQPFDVWNYDCFFFNSNSNCPSPAGPNYGFSQGPMLFKAGEGSSKRELIGAGQKSGQFWALNPLTGQINWLTQAGPGGLEGGMVDGSASDGNFIYTADSNSGQVSWNLPNGSVTSAAIWSALNPSTGEIMWQTPNPTGAGAGGAVSVANDVLYACSLDPAGTMFALDARTGAVLWSFASGGSCNAGPAIVQGTVYWGSGFTDIFGNPSYTSNNKLYAFGLNN